MCWLAVSEQAEAKGEEKNRGLCKERCRQVQERLLVTGSIVESVVPLHLSPEKCTAKQMVNN